MPAEKASSLSKWIGSSKENHSRVQLRLKDLIKEDTVVSQSISCGLIVGQHNNSNKLQQYHT